MIDSREEGGYIDIQSRIRRQHIWFAPTAAVLVVATYFRLRIS